MKLHIRILHGNMPHLCSRGAQSYYCVWMPPEAWHGRRPAWLFFRSIEEIRRGRA